MKWGRVGRRPKDLPLEELAKLYEGGCSKEELALRYRTSAATVGNYLRKAWKLFPPSEWGHMGQDWRPVVGYERLYEVSEYGLVRSLGRIRFVRRYGMTRKYMIVPLTRDGVATSISVHKIVAEAFLGPRPLGHEINHKDGNTCNNHWKNLAYVSPEDNMAHATSMGLILRGENHPHARLREIDVWAMRTLRACGWSHAKISKEFGIAENYAMQITSRKAWAHV